MDETNSTVKIPYSLIQEYPTEYLISLSDVEDIDERDISKFIAEYSEKIDWEKVYEHCKDSTTLVGLTIHGHMYDYVKEDISKAKYYYDMAIEKGSWMAMYKLAQIYAEGKGDIERDFTKAENYFKIVFEKGFEYAAYKLGYLYMNGNSDEKDTEKAIHYFKIAVEKGINEAIVYLAKMYTFDDDVETDYEQAIHYLKIGVERGHSVSMSNLALMYIKGAGVEKDLDKALYYYHMAHENGSSTALTKIKQILKALAKDEAFIKRYFDEKRELVRLKAENSKLREENEELNLLQDAPAYHEAKKRVL